MSKKQNTLEVEEWRDIPGFVGKYQISNIGRIRSLTAVVGGSHGSTRIVRGKLIALERTRTGYLRARLCINGKGSATLVHRLVLEAFVGPCPKGMECRHFPDKDRANCRLDNLQWGTRKANHADKEVHETQQHGERNGMSKLTADIVREIFRLAALEKYSHREIGEMFGVRSPAIWNILAGNTWKHIDGRPLNIKPVKRRARFHTKETRAKMSAAHKGIPKSPEHRAALSASQRALFLKKKASQNG